MYWNNIGRYDDIGPDPSATDVYSGSAMEAGSQFRKPAFSSKIPPLKENTDGKPEKASEDEMISALDSVLEKDRKERQKKNDGFLLRVQAFWNNSNE